MLKGKRIFSQSLGGNLEDILKKIRVRPIEKGDLDAITEIDYKILGQRRPEYWRQKIEEGSHPIQSLVAEYNQRVIGFIIGTVSGWEFGVPSSFGWIDTIGVDPEFQKKGVATLLFRSIVKSFSKEGVKKIYTLVKWEDWNLMSFFRKMGFSRGELINLEYLIE